MNKIHFSIVTTCRNEIKSLHRWKQNMLDQTREPNEIVIVDAFSNDGTFEYIKDWAKTDKRINVIQENGAAAHGRNVAISNAKYDYLFSTDMGVGLSKIWCEELIKPFEKDSSVDLVVGNTCFDLTDNNSAFAWAEYYLEQNRPIILGPESVPGNRSVAYKKKVWNEMGGLPEDLSFYADDSLFFRQVLQANYKIDYAPDAMTYWSRPTKAKEFKREMFVYGKGDGEALIKTPRIIKVWINGKFPKLLVPVTNGIWTVLKHKNIVPMKRALFNGNIKATFLVPYLHFIRGHYFAKGYLIGYENGKINCTAARKRIKRDEKGFSLF